MNPITEIKYKKFKLEVDHKTPLSDFAPPALDAYREKFNQYIAKIKVDYINTISGHIPAMEDYELLDEVVEEIKQSNKHIEDIFQDFSARMDYFTIMFFGAVSAGKTSMICDLSNSNPLELTSQLAQDPQYNPETDGFVIGPNVSTMNLYEILIKQSKVRLVDVPGIGGVVHDNSTLAPFVDMADCIVFLLNASNDIMQNDIDFLKENVIALKQVKGKSNQLVNEGKNKVVLIVVNKWASEVEDMSIEEAEEHFQTKKVWILDGNIQKGFQGLDGLFNKVPVVVRANTSKRDKSSGISKRIPDIDETVSALRNIVEEEGAEVRLKRPIVIFNKELDRIETVLLNLRAQKSVSGLFKELGKYGSKITDTTQKMEYQLNLNLDAIESKLHKYIGPRLRVALQGWEPNVSLIKYTKMIFDTEGTKEELRKEWEEELSKQVKAQLDPNAIRQMTSREIQNIVTYISSQFKAAFSDASPELREKIIHSHVKKISDVNGVEGDVKLDKLVEGISENVENKILSALLNIITIDGILWFLFGAILNVWGSLLALAWTMFGGGGKKKAKLRETINNTVDIAASSASSNIRSEMQKEIVNALLDLTNAYMKLIHQERKELEKPLELIDLMLADIKNYRQKMVNVTESL